MFAFSASRVLMALAIATCVVSCGPKGQQGASNINASGFSGGDLTKERIETARNLGLEILKNLGELASAVCDVRRCGDGIAACDSLKALSAESTSQAKLAFLKKRLGDRTVAARVQDSLKRATIVMVDDAAVTQNHEASVSGTTISFLRSAVQNKSQTDLIALLLHEAGHIQAGRLNYDYFTDRGPVLEDNGSASAFSLGEDYLSRFGFCAAVARNELPASESGGASPAGPTLLFSDEFNRPSAASLGPNWRTRLGAVQLSRPYAEILNTESGASVENISVRDVRVRSQVSLACSWCWIHLIGRYQNDSNHYLVALGSSDGAMDGALYVRVGGTYTELQRAAVQISGPDDFRRELVLDVQTVVWNGATTNKITWSYGGVVYGTVYDSRLPTNLAATAGIRGYSAKFKSFSIEQLP